MKLMQIVEEAWKSGFSTKSDLARVHANTVAMAASDGLITTKIATGLYGRTWRVTLKGLKALWGRKGLNDED